MPLYFIAVLAPQHINEYALLQKQYMLGQFQCKVALRSPAHITLIPPFNAPVSIEPVVNKELLAIASGLQPFEITVSDFDFFSPRVVFMNVQVSPELKSLKNNVEDRMLEIGLPIKTETRPFHPHITIANRDLKKEDFPAAKKYFQQLKFKDQFIFENIVLLRSYPDGWKIV